MVERTIPTRCTGSGTGPTRLQSSSRPNESSCGTRELRTPKPTETNLAITPTQKVIIEIQVEIIEVHTYTHVCNTIPATARSGRNHIQISCGGLCGSTRSHLLTSWSVGYKDGQTAFQGIERCRWQARCHCLCRRERRLCTRGRRRV
jgi:hypothetical protein